MEPTDGWVTFADGALRLMPSRVALLEINAPERRNALSLAMWTAIEAVAERVEADESIRVLLVRGAGGKAFSAGADIGEFADVYATPESTADYNARVRRAQARLRDLPRPTIAVVDGVCVGGGCGLALACDLRFAATDARFGITPARLGLAYSYADTAQLVEKVGPARAKDILFSGRLLEAGEALAIGLVDRLAAPEALTGTVADYAEGLAALSQTSIRAAKAIINRLADRQAESSADMDALFSDSFSGPDFREGYAAFLAKRRPVFG
ncbi:enoyl-CoA hydratase-related protein [Oceanibacterium hippocampi]|uniref:Putative enoyl-CoA hydratase echA8 n=1 Tax=Oceanibacterium hippocampi TaxID=745714 RepID=A0A1Y5TZN0_9PROT|nr:enoyl-CoA hydratase-related protein [Oceanibacterium hippocampi]SLN75416.1 putative enoyl-CoA hydratase echA8 [Oceanibacterium hippocampi]